MTRVYLKGRKSPLQLKSREQAERFIAGAMKEVGVPRSWFTIEDDEDTLEDIVRDGLALVARLGVDPALAALLK